MPTRKYSFAAVLTVVTVVLEGCQGFRGQRSNPDDLRPGPSATFPDTAGVSFSQHVDLQDVRFLMRKGNRLFVELSFQENAEWRQSFDYERIPYGFGDALPADLQEQVLLRCQDRIGMSFCCYRACDGQSFMARLESLASYAEGGNGDVGFVGLLDVLEPGPDAPNEDLWGDEAIGIAYPAESRGIAECRPLTRLAPSACRVLQSKLRAALRDETCGVLSAVRNPGDGAIVAVTQRTEKEGWWRDTADGNREWVATSDRRELFYLVEDHDTVQIVPFGRVASMEAFTAFPLDVDDYPGNGGDTRVFFLPDLDADGRCELLVEARESFIYDPARAFAPSTDRVLGQMKLLRSFFYGLRE
jgi:hypothetical protein